MQVYVDHGTQAMIDSSTPSGNLRNYRCVYRRIDGIPAIMGVQAFSRDGALYKLCQFRMWPKENGKQAVLDMFDYLKAAL